MTPLLWRHVIFNTKSTWLPGDPRGFRNRKHRIHSSGDYKSPPPRGEHAKLHDYMKRKSSAEVHVELDLRPIAGAAMVAFCREQHIHITTLAISKVHVHALIELVNDLREVKRIVGEIKRKSSRALKEWLPGSVWASGGAFKPVQDEHHWSKADEYILFEQGPHAWTWSERDVNHDGRFGRTRENDPAFAWCAPKSGATRVRSAPA